MARPSELGIAHPQDLARPRALEKLGVGKGVAGDRLEPGYDRDIAGELESLRSGQSDVEELRRERGEVGNLGRDDVLVAVVEPGGVQPYAIVCEPLLDAGFERARTLRLQVGVPEKERRRAERLQQRRLLDRGAGARPELRRADLPVALVDVPRGGDARHGRIAEAGVVLEPDAGRDDDLLP